MYPHVYDANSKKKTIYMLMKLKSKNTTLSEQFQNRIEMLY